MSEPEGAATAPLSERDRPKRPDLRSHWARLNHDGRVSGVDLARGLAVLGMFAAHLITTPDFVWTDASTWVGVVDGRSSILFATLAGVSIGLVTGGTRVLGPVALSIARRRLAVRAGAIWLLGILLIATGVPVYVILPAYGVLFLLMLPALRLPVRWLFGLAAVIAVVGPVVQFLIWQLPLWQSDGGELFDLLIGGHYPVIIWSAFVLAGLGIGRLDLDETRTAVGLVAAGTGLAVLGYLVPYFLRPTNAASQVPVDPTFAEGFLLFLGDWRPHSSGIAEVVGSGGVAIAAIGVCLLLCATPLTWLALPLRALGSMPLTAYTAQLVVWFAIAVALGMDPGDLFGFRALEPFWPFALCTMAGCTAWALLVGRGPLEGAITALSRSLVPGPSAEPTQTALR